MSILLEVCIASVSDAVAAHRGGAGRLELNSALALGGLTPTRGLLREVLAATPLPVVAMLRPRPGGCAYDAGELRTMQRDLDDLLAESIAGVALGVLLPDGRVDHVRTALLVRQAQYMPVVFHRAFDLTPNPFVALDDLTDLGVVRVLTSGQSPTAVAGADTLARLVAQSAGRVEILPAGGIRPENVRDLLARTGCTAVHASLRAPRHEPSASGRPTIRFGAMNPAEEEWIDGTDAGRVADLVAVLQGAV